MGLSFEVVSSSLVLIPLLETQTTVSQQLLQVCADVPFG